MALIKNRPPQTKTKLNGKEISTFVFNEIEQYCDWAGVKDIGVFIEEAALLVFKSDKDWKKHLKQNRQLSDCDL
jgi:hypothetical protein